jgi:hypothetical protein
MSRILFRSGIWPSQIEERFALPPIVIDRGGGWRRH